MFKIQRQHLAIQIVALGLMNIRTMLHNVVLSRKSVARMSKVAWWSPPLYPCVVWPWECCKTRRIWSCNAVLPLQHSWPQVYTPYKLASTFAVRPIALTHVPPEYSYDAVASSHNTRFCCTTNAPLRKTYRKIYYISLHNARLMAPQILRAFVRALFSISSLARHFGRIRSCNNCERPIRL